MASSVEGPESLTSVGLVIERPQRGHELRCRPMPERREGPRPGRPRAGGEQADGPLNVVVWGEGDRVVCVHGSLSWGTFAFREQRSLAGSHSLVLPDRRGYGASALTGRSDFSMDADDIVTLLGDGAHLVGHSYGAVVAMLAAVRRPDAVRTLTVAEPAALSVARGDPAVEELIASLAGVQAVASSLSPAEFALRFLEAFGYRRGVDMPDPPKLNLKGIRAATTTMTERPPWEAEIALDALASAGRPTLIVSGRWDNLAAGEAALGRRALGAVCDALARSLEARRVIIDGWAHGCQYSGEPFNGALRSLWASGI
jgi:pimeloyl-ACP methyl ester carboxylesterase